MYMDKMIDRIFIRNKCTVLPKESKQPLGDLFCGAGLHFAFGLPAR